MKYTGERGTNPSNRLYIIPPMARNEKRIRKIVSTLPKFSLINIIVLKIVLTA
jgi:hypothetical protein